MFFGSDDYKKTFFCGTDLGVGDDDSGGVLLISVPGVLDVVDTRVVEHGVGQVLSAR